jgi:serine/threonine protein kinase
MKRTPKSFDASIKQDPKHFVQDDDDETLLRTSNYPMMVINEELSADLNRLQVSSSNNNSESGVELGSSHNSDECLAELQETKKVKRPSSSSRKKRRNEAELLASLSTAAPTMQEEEEQSFTRCLDSGVRSAQLTGFFFAKDEELKQFTVFRIEVVTVAQAWSVYRRYSDFVTLAAKLQDVSPPNFPPKTPFGGNFAKDFLHKRQMQLSQWLEKALAIAGVVTLSDMRAFLVSEANCPPASLANDTALQKNSSSTSSQGSEHMRRSETPPPSVPMVPDAAAAATAPSTPNGLNIVYSDTSPGVQKTKSPFTNPRKVNVNDFELLQVLGKGSFGKVVLASKRTGRDEGTLYAMKILNKQNVVNKKQVEHTLTERSVLGKMSHPFIVKLHYAFQTDKKLHFVLDYCPGGELFFHLGRAGRFSEDQGRFYAAEMTLALGHLHNHGVVYRDLKPENILFEANGHLKLADFGLSKEGVESTQGSTSFCGTPEYLAPEVLNRSGHGTAVDWWSLGALLYEMLTGLPPWFSQDRQKLFLGIRQAPLRFPPEVSPLARSILCDFLKRDPLERLGSEGVDQVKRHPFFQSIDWVALYELRLPAPFIPKVTGDQDTGNFDSTFTRLPVHSEACSPMLTLLPVQQTSPQRQVVQQLVQQQPMAMSLKKASTEDVLFGGFTYQEEHGSGMATPPTPYSISGLCTPPPMPANKRASPLRPTGPNLYHARPSSSASSSMAKTPSLVPASSPPVSG